MHYTCAIMYIHIYIHTHDFNLYIHIYTHTSGVLEHKWRASLKTILFLLTSNTEATENKVQCLNLAYRVKGFQCHSNNSLQLLELKEKQQQQNNTRYLKVFFVIVFS